MFSVEWRKRCVYVPDLRVAEHETLPAAAGEEESEKRHRYVASLACLGMFPTRVACLGKNSAAFSRTLQVEKSSVSRFNFSWVGWRESFAPVGVHVAGLGEAREDPCHILVVVAVGVLPAGALPTR